MADELSVDVDTLTLGDIEFIEEYTGVPAARWAAVMADPAVPHGRLMTALVFVAGRAGDPSFTLEMARQTRPGA